MSISIVTTSDVLVGDGVDLADEIGKFEVTKDENDKMDGGVVSVYD